MLLLLFFLCADLCCSELRAGEPWVHFSWKPSLQSVFGRNKACTSLGCWALGWLWGPAAGRNICFLLWTQSEIL